MNTLLLVIDSLRADVVWGERVPTVNLDALARNGAAFHQCVATSTTTTPSFASILTGCYPPKHGVRGLQGYRLSDEVKTMAEAFGEAGYHTYAEVTGPLLPETGVLRGFDDVHHRQGYRVPFFGWRDRIVEAMHSYREPWFMLLHIWEVHRPFRSPPDFEKRFDKQGYEAAVAASDEWLAPVFDACGDDTLVVVTGDHGETYTESTFQKLAVRSARKTRRALRTHRWLPALDSRLAGLSVGHGFGLQEELVRVPLIVTGPGVPAVVSTHQVRHVDLFPTLAGLCGLKPPPEADGHSLQPSLQGQEPVEEPAYMEAVGVKLEGRRIVGARLVDWKLVLPGVGRPALYRLDEGAAPDEKRNVYNRHPEVARRLESFIASVESGAVDRGSGMTEEQEAIVEAHLRDLGYL